MLNLLAIAIALVSAAAPTQVAASDASDSPQAKSDVDKIVCKKEEPVGTRMAAKKVCLTVGEWEARAKADRDETERVQRDTPVPH